MNLRILNPTGLDAAANLLRDLRAGALQEVPRAFLLDPAMSTDTGVPIGGGATSTLTNRFEVGLWTYKLLTHRDFDRTNLYNPGLWTWLTLYLFDVICPRTQTGGRAWQKDDARYIFDRGNFRKQYRHLLAGPYFLVKTHFDEIGSVRAVLSNPPQTPGELFEQLSSRKPIFMSTAAMSVATSLYWDNTAMKLKRGAGGSGQGSPRRLADVLMQLDVTHDLIATTHDALLALLPREFQRWG